MERKKKHTDSKMNKNAHTVLKIKQKQKTDPKLSPTSLKKRQEPSEVLTKNVCTSTVQFSTSTVQNTIEPTIGFGPGKEVKREETEIETVTVTVSGSQCLTV